MAETPISNNPYRPLADRDVMVAPFAGRQKVFEYLHQRLASPQGPRTSIILGRRDTGKTSLLRHFDTAFDDTFICVYLALKPLRLESEADWLNALAGATTRELMARNISMARADRLEPIDPVTRDWFGEQYLPEVFSIIRKHRRLIYLLDDAGALVRARQSGRLPEDTFTFLHDLLTRFSGLGFVLATDSQYETDLVAMSPLVGPTDVYRLQHLTEEETGWLLDAPVEGKYGLTRDARAAVYRATGGHPRLAQRFGFHLHRRWEERPAVRVLTVDHVKQVSQPVYSQSEDDFRALWSSLEHNERLALTAITHLLYADPLAHIDAGAVERWLVESDFPLDATAINAAIRGLEYREIVETLPDGMRVRSGLMQRWLLENARLGGPKAAGRQAIPWWAAVALLAALIVLLALIAGQSRGPDQQSTPAVQPTITLVSGP